MLANGDTCSLTPGSLGSISSSTGFQFKICLGSIKSGNMEYHFYYCFVYLQIEDLDRILCILPKFPELTDAIYSHSFFHFIFQLFFLLP